MHKSIYCLNRTAAVRRMLMSVCIVLSALSAYGTDPYIGYTFSTSKYKCEVVGYDGYLDQWCVSVNGISTADDYNALGLPSELTYKSRSYRVTAVGDSAFKGRTKFTYVRLGYGITHVGAEAFAGCTSLQTLLLPSTLDSVGVRAFADCGKLKNVQCLSVDPPSTSEDAFSGSTQNVVLSLSLLSDSTMVRYRRSAAWGGFMNYVRSGEGYDYRSDGFHYVVKRRATRNTPGELVMGWLSTSSATDGVLKLSSGTQIFDGLEYVVAEVADSANTGNGALRSVDLSACSAMRRIGRHAFDGCGQLSSVSVVADTLDDYAFARCGKLVSLTLGEGVRYVGAGVATGSAALRELLLPATLKGMRVGAFVGLSALNAFKVASGNPWLTAIDGVLYSVDRSVLYSVPACQSSLTLPEGLLTVAGYAFSGNTALAEVDLPYGVLSFGAHAFDGCSALRRVKVPSSLQQWGGDAFVDCSSLRELIVNMPLAPSVSRSEFRGVPAECVLAIPGRNTVDGVNPIGSYSADTLLTRRFAAIKTGAYDALLSGGELAVSVTAVSSHSSSGVAFDGYARLVRPLNVEASAASRLTIPWQAAVSGKMYEIEEIGDSAFADCLSLVAVTAEAGVRYVADAAFAGCVSLQSVSLPSVHTLSDRAFYGCTSLQTVDLSGGWLATLGDEVFCGCTSLGNVLLGGRLKRVGSRAFAGSGLVSLELPYGVTMLGAEALADCALLERVQLPSSLVSLGADVLSGCQLLRTLMVNCADPPRVASGMMSETMSGVDLVVPVGSVAKYRLDAAFGGVTWHSVTTGSYDLLHENSGALLGFTVERIPDRSGAGQVAVVRTASLSAIADLVVPDEVVDGSGQRYEVVTIADSLCAYSAGLRSVRMGANVRKIGVAAFMRAADLQTVEMGDAPIEVVERSAFYRTGIREITLPSTVRWLGVRALASCPQLQTVVCRSLHPEEMTAESGLYDNGNAPNFTFYVDHRVYGGYYSLLMRNGVTCLAPYVEVTSPVMPFSCGASVSFVGSGLHCYLPASLTLDESDRLPMREVSSLCAFAGAVIRGEQGDEVQLRVVEREEAETLDDNPLRCVLSAYTLQPSWTNYYQYRFVDGHSDPVCFERVREPIQYTDNEELGTAFLRLSATEVGPREQVALDLPRLYAPGDLDGNGNVDVGDVNMMINVIIGYTPASAYVGRADMSGDGLTDVSDLNMLISLLL